jgi:hypothetical protein
MERGSLPIQQLASRHIPFFASQGSNRRRQRKGIEFMFHAAHAPMKLVYARLAIGAATSLWLVCSSASERRLDARQELKWWLIESKLRQDITPAPDADPFLAR